MVKLDSININARGYDFPLIVAAIPDNRMEPGLDAILKQQSDGTPLHIEHNESDTPCMRCLIKNPRLRVEWIRNILGKAEDKRDSDSIVPNR